MTVADSRKSVPLKSQLLDACLTYAKKIFMLKKRFIAMLAALTISTAAITTPRESKAIIGVATMQVAFLATGAVFLAVGAVYLGALVPQAGYYWPLIVIAPPGAWVPLAGIVLLDEPGGARPEFHPIELSQAENLKVSPEDLQDFNSEVEELNAIRDSLEKDYVGSTLPLKEAGNEIVQKWKDALGQLSPGTSRVLKAIAPRNLK
jgi:hypothetical protein